MLLPSRKANRLNNFDYASKRLYFITLCTFDKLFLFGEIADKSMKLNQNGKIVQSEWQRSSEIRDEMILDEFIIMPNHLHGIILINKNVGATGRSPAALTNNGPKNKSLGSFIAGFKSSVTTQINELRKTPKQFVWQRNYHDHIIRDQTDLNRVREYIINNPSQWAMDELNSQNCN